MKVEMKNYITPSEKLQGWGEIVMDRQEKMIYQTAPVVGEILYAVNPVEVDGGFGGPVLLIEIRAVAELAEPVQ